MNIDCKNFSKHLKQILSDLQRCDFVSFDGEFSGLKTIPFASESEFQSEEEFYQRMKDTCINFSLLQIGLCMFHWKDGKYEPSCYNFYLKHNTGDGRRTNNVMMTQVDCLDFLSRNKMDWNRVFHLGITSSRLSEKQLIEKRCREGIQVAPTEYVFLQKKDQDLVDDILAKIKEFKKSDSKGLVVDFVNRTVYSEVKRLSNIQLDKEAKLNLKEFEYVLRQTANQPKNEKPKYVEVKKPTQPEILSDEKLNKEGTNQLEVGEKEESNKKKTPSKNHKADSHQEDDNDVQLRIQQEMGLSLVIEHMIKMKKPLVGHFASLDLGFLYQTFIGELPNSFAEFCQSLRTMFPYILDTKVISKTVQHSIKGLRVDLSSLFESLFNPKLLKPYTNVNHNAYEGAEVEHEAGYDAYITGSCLVAMLNYNHHMSGAEKHIEDNGKQHEDHAKHPDKKHQYKEKHEGLVHPRIDFQKCPWNGRIYSKFSGEVLLNGIETNKLENRVIIIEGSIEEAAQVLNIYGSFKVTVKQLNYAKFNEDQDTRAIVAAHKSQHFKLIHYRDRRQFRARTYLQ